MDFFRVVEERHSMRKFKDSPVEEKKLLRILTTASLAPSGGNQQGYEIYVVRKAEQRRELVKAAWDQEHLAEAPVVVVFCANPARSAVKYGERGANLYSIQDATIACTYAILAAKALDLDSAWVGAFDEEAVRKAIGIPANLKPVVMMPVGYAGAEPSATPRRELKDLIHEA
jgi:nitroreductase